MVFTGIVRSRKKIPLTSDKIYYVNLSVSMQQLPDSGDHKDVLMGHFAETGRQQFNLVLNRFLLVHDKYIPALYPAQTALCFYSGSAEVFFGNANAKLFRKIF